MFIFLRSVTPKPSFVFGFSDLIPFDQVVLPLQMTLPKESLFIHINLISARSSPFTLSLVKPLVPKTF